MSILGFAIIVLGAITVSVNVLRFAEHIGQPRRHRTA